MNEAPLHLLQVSAWERQGGAERIALDLMHWLRARGHRAQLAVGHRSSSDADVFEIPNGEERRAWYAAMGAVQRSVSGRGAIGRKLARVAGFAAEPLTTLDRLRGIEPMRYPGTRRLLELGGVTPDILHCHNLHRDYFDLRELPRLSHAVPTVLTLHDAWLLSGHCAHSFTCDRWRTGCGRCPDLTSYPPVRRDATAYNWARKQDVFARSRLYVATPSNWLMEKVRASMLAPAVVEGRVIPNGVDLSVFRPGDRTAARAALGLPPDAHILLFAGNRVRTNPFKDFETFRAALASISVDKDREVSGHRPLVCVLLGDDGEAERVGRCDVRPAGFEADTQRVAQFYQAADVYVHAARADTFPTTVLEALACGTPVVASSVGGVPEQVRSLTAVEAGSSSPLTVGAAAHDPGEATGLLVPAGDAAAMAGALQTILSDDALRARLSANAADDARRRFDASERFGDYLAWYREIKG